MSQYDLCYGEKGSSPAILLTLNNQAEADKLAALINRADRFQGDSCEASVREVEREAKPEAQEAPKPRARARKKDDQPDGEGIG